MNTNIKLIQVFGSDCPICIRLHELTRDAVKEMNIPVKVEYIQDIQKILDMGLMSAPILAINGQPVLAGGFPTLDKIKELLNSYAKDEGMLKN